MALSIVGGMLIPVSIYGLHGKRSSTAESEWQMPVCATPSPDQSLRCKQVLGHLGWHEGGTKSWYGDCWFEGQTADTKRYRDQRPIEKRPIEQPRITGSAMKKSAIAKSGRRQPRRPLTDGEKQLIQACKNGNWRLREAPWRQFEYVGRSAATSKVRRAQPKLPHAAQPNPPQPKPPQPKPQQSKPTYPNIIGPEPIKVRVGMFGTRRTLPNDRDRKSA